MTRSGNEIVWILDGLSPDQIPLSRLAEYMQQFAALLGNDDDIRFARIENGSTKLIATLSAGRSARRAQARVYAVKERRAPAEAVRAFRRMNEMVGQDRTVARLTFGAGAVLRFSGNMAEPTPPVTLVDTATVTGRLYALWGAPSGLVHARITPRTGGNYVACTAEGKIARDLGSHFMGAVRVQGRGYLDAL